MAQNKTPDKRVTKYFVTGASGFIGQRLVKSIDGIIRVLSRKKLANYETIVCDLQVQDIPESALDGIDVVFHLAGFSHDMRKERKVNNLYQAINVDTTEKLANLSIKSGVSSFVFISSVKAGGLPLNGYCDNEESKKRPDGIYGKTKREAELILLDLAKKTEMHVSIIRPSLVYGPKVKGNLELMLLGIKNSWFPPLPETGNKRSMIHVDDLVRAILLVSEDDRANGEIFIATDGIPHSSREIYNSLCNVAEKSIPKWYVPKILFDIASLASPNIKYKVNKLLGNECYSSAKLEALGFKAIKSLKDMNETSF